MKVFLDTNVLVSAVATRGLCTDVLREVLARHELMISAHLLKEPGKVLHEKINVPESLISEFIQFVQQGACCSEASAIPDIPLKDENDLLLLSAAMNGKADLFVTGDKELIELQKTGNMEIVSPRLFWEKLKSPQKNTTNLGKPKI